MDTDRKSEIRVPEIRRKEDFDANGANLHELDKLDFTLLTWIWLNAGEAVPTVPSVPSVPLIPFFRAGWVHCDSPRLGWC